MSLPPAAPSETCGRLTFLGGVSTVTGSKHLLTTGDGHRFLIDCGLLDGPAALRPRNGTKPAFSPATIEAVVLSQAHIHHSGHLPLLAREGFRGPIYCTPPTADLLRAVLLDRARLQDEEAESADRDRAPERQSYRPPYTTADAYAALQRIAVRGYGQPFAVVPGATAVFRRSAHLLGAATVEIRLGAASPLRLVYSGDLGRPRLVARGPDPVGEADVLVVESTYGDRRHSGDGVERLAEAIRDGAARGGAVIVPSFFGGDEILWTLRRLENETRIPRLPTFLDGPVAVEPAEVRRRHAEEYAGASAADREAALGANGVGIVRTVDESKALSARRGPMIIVAGDGTVGAGRVLRHLKLRLPDTRTTVVLAGHQAAGTSGRALQEGAKEIFIRGHAVPVRARVVSIDGLSAHADRDDVLRWLGGFVHPPTRTYVVHGEPQAAKALAAAVRDRLGWSVRVPEEGETVALESARGSRRDPALAMAR